ncbi:MAG: aromatic ring-hydroxylating dioxygenase subunit alpha [Gammaproteobacteria bacterium]|nr:aromatic ring-hydroxylating dioxygenase subunit alpha [Gammaproteobacteria bacterium]
MIESEALLNDWHVVYRSSDLGDGAVEQVRLLGHDLVIWRSAGKAVAWLDQCPHRGARLSLGHIRDSELVCPYHGWRYDANGQCTHIPAQPNDPIPSRACAKRFHCAEQSGFIWVCLGEPSHPIPTHPEWEHPDFINVFTGPYTFHTSAPRAVENVVDVTHFPFVHDAMLGQEGEPEAIDDYEVEQTNAGLRAGPIVVSQPAGDHRRQPVQSTYRFWIPRPLMPYLMKSFDDTRCFSHFMPVTPVEDDVTLMWVLTSANFDKEDGAPRIAARNDDVFGEDVPIVNSQRPAMIPMTLNEELHIRADKLSVLYRRWLTDLGISGAKASEL